MRVLLCPVGSHGDVHPFIGIGLAMQARGHSVTLIAAEPYQALAERHGFAFDQLGTTAEFHELTNDPNLWHPTRSLRVVFREDLLRRYLPLAFNAIRKHYVPGDTVLAAGVLSMASRIAHEKFGIPLATVHLQPMGMMSVANPPRFPNGKIPGWVPHSLRRAMIWAADRFIIDPYLKKPINDFRRTLDLPPISRIWGPWRNSPQLVLGLFPTWFGTAPDWPPQLQQPGFVRYDQAEKPLPREVDDYLNAGEPPLVISLGSAMFQARPYFETFVEVCQQLSRRGLILAKSGEQIPPLPETVQQFDYAPFSQVFPRAAAVIHHGGIGTTAQALAAGVLQLVNALAFDQPDNGERVQKLGAGVWLPSTEFTTARVTKLLASLLANGRVRGTCREIANRFTQEQPAVRACELLESLHGRDVRV